MSRAYLIGLDIAKNVFQVFAADEKGGAIAKKKLSRSDMKEYFTLLAPIIRPMRLRLKPFSKLCMVAKYSSKLFA
ncbi:MAG: hypothetical protein LBV65_05195 [Desulfovibrio sp.]|jgi:transposase|nr:hypothetical protein [Desulfovibrio sp.]